MLESELTSKQLYRRCLLEDLPFETTDDFGEIASAEFPLKVVFF